MRLSAKLLVNWANVNQFDYTTINQWQIRAGDPNTLYFQLVDLDQDGLRYIPGVGMQNQPAGVVVTMPSIDNTKVLQFQAIQADANDASIWKVVIASTQIPNTGNVIFNVMEGSASRSFSVMAGLSVELPGASGSC